MARPIRLVLFLVVIWHVPAFANDSILAKYAQSLKGQQFTLRAHEQLFGSPTASKWDGRLLYEAEVEILNGTVAIGRDTEWQGNYFVSGTPYIVKDVTTHADVLQLKLRALGVVREPEVKLDFRVSGMTLELFKKALFTIFFDPSESPDAYIKENNRKLVAKFIDPEPELLLLPDEQRLRLLIAIRAISLSSRPKLDRLGKDLYVPAAVIGNTSVYNDIRVNKNQRIASSIEALLPDFRRVSKAAADFPEAIAGVEFQWSVYHRNFLDNSNSSKEDMEMLISREALKAFTNGDLSPFELVQKSVLRENGVKVTLASYDPIGSTQ
jgi:hypothetical protein